MSDALRVADASFVRDGERLVEPFSQTLADGNDLLLAAPTRRAATIVARMCAAIVKPTTGTIYVGDFQTRLQSPQAKRLVGYVDASPFAGDAHAFRCEVAFRADVWNLDHAAAMRRATGVVAAFAPGPLDGFARALALALVADVRLVILDQPPAEVLDTVRTLVPAAGIVSVGVAATVSAHAGSPIESVR